MSEPLQDQIASEPDLIIPASKAIARTFGRANTRWTPGVSGNPSGINRTVHQARKLFRIRAPELAEQLIHLALTAEDERVKSVCLIACLGNAGIKPQEYDPNADKPDGPTLNVDALTAEQRAQLRYLLQQAATLPADGEHDSQTEHWSEQDDRDEVDAAWGWAYVEGESRVEASQQDARDVSGWI
jgi:hypothetical protein